MASEAQYLNAKSRFVEFKITAMSAFPDYTGGETFKIFFAYDDDNSTYGYPDKPALVARNRLPPVRETTEPSLKDEWFPNVDDFIVLENGAQISFASWYANGEANDYTYGINCTAKNIRFRTPAGDNVGGSTSLAGLQVTSSIKEKPEAGAVASNYRLGCWIFIRMTQKWSDFIKDLFDTSISATTMNTRYHFCNYPVVALATVGDFNIYRYQTSGSPPGRTSNGMFSWNIDRWRLFFTGLTPENNTFTGDESQPSGGPNDPDGNGEHYNEREDSDTIEPDDPTQDGSISASTAGGIRTYLMTTATLNGFHDFMFSDAFNNTWDSVRKAFYDPQSCVVGLHTIPLQISTGGLVSENIHLGNCPSDVTGFVIDESYAHIDCGTIHINEIWANFLDYAPYTSASLYLPYCSTVEVPINEIMNADVNIVYNIDLFTGSCVAEVSASKGNFNGVILRVPGNCSVNIPWSSSDSSRQWSAIMGLTGAVALSAVTAGMSTAAATATAGAMRTAEMATVASAVSPEAAMSSGLSASVINAGEQTAKSTALGKAVITNATSIAQSAPGIVTQHINRGGTCGSNLGAMQTPYPYLIITRPVQSYPAGYEHFYGFTSNITSQLSQLSGFTKVQAINLEHLQKATTDEVTLIKEALMSGVYL